MRNSAPSWVTRSYYGMIGGPQEEGNGSDQWFLDLLVMASFGHNLTDHMILKSYGQNILALKSEDSPWRALNFLKRRLSMESLHL